MLSFFNPLPSLPQYTGPFKVGTSECEILLSSLGLSDLLSNINIETVKFRIFYPTKPDVQDEYHVPWLQHPQTNHLQAYLNVFKLGTMLTNAILSVPLYLRSARIPAVQDAPLDNSQIPIPVIIFSHGLLGNLNSHSGLLGELASRGFFCIAVDHRDGSGALSFTRRDVPEAAEVAPTEATVSWKKISFNIKKAEVFEQRDEQFEIRLFELMATYRALELLNEGESLRNVSQDKLKAMKFPRGAFKLTPGSVTWAGHSFGGASIFQFVKSVYHEDSLEHLANHSGDSQMPKSLFVSPLLASLKSQITPASPVILLDPWFLPLRSPRTRWLLERRLPCHDLDTEHPFQATTVAILTSEAAHTWPEIHSHIDLILAADPASAPLQTHDEVIDELDKWASPNVYMAARKRFWNAAENKAKTELADGKGWHTQVSPRTSLYVLQDTCHLTQSDIGLLFPWLLYWLNGQKEPQLATVNTAKCIMNAAGFPLGSDDCATERIEEVNIGSLYQALNTFRTTMEANKSWIK